jgi:hypothetical protein
MHKMLQLLHLRRPLVVVARLIARVGLGSMAPTSICAQHSRFVRRLEYLRGAKNKQDEARDHDDSCTDQYCSNDTERGGDPERPIAPRCKGLHRPPTCPDTEDRGRKQYDQVGDQQSTTFGLAHTVQANEQDKETKTSQDKHTYEGNARNEPERYTHTRIYPFCDHSRTAVYRVMPPQHCNIPNECYHQE